MQLFLIRHPRPAVAEGVCYGRSDLGLVESSRVVADRLMPLLPPDLPVYSSPLRRCRELAEALHPVPILDPRLMEINFGAWEMRAWDAIPKGEIDAWAADPLGFRPPGGESVGMMRERVADFIIERQREGSSAIVLVTHAGVMKVIAGALLGMPVAEWLVLRFDYATLTIVDIDLP